MCLDIQTTAKQVISCHGQDDTEWLRSVQNSCGKCEKLTVLIVRCVNL